MTLTQELIQKAEFNQKIKTYIFLLVAFFLTISVVGIPLLLIWFLGVGQHISKRFYESLECKLTKEHLEFKKGVLFKLEKTIPIENIQDITFIENPLLKYLDLNILKIETAGQSNPHGSDMKLVGIIDSLAFKERIFHQRALIKNDNLIETTEKGMGSEQIISILEEIRNVLFDIKNK